MRILELFNRDAAIPRIDLVWLNRAAKLKGAVNYLAQNRTDLCVAWFEETQLIFNRCFEENHITIPIKMADSLGLYDLNKKITVFLEHYPLYSREAHVLSKNKPQSICFMNSLDDTFFRLFGGKIEKLMRAMGIGEDENIESPMISATVIRAQKKIEKKACDDFHARSGEEWMERYRTYCQHHLR